jgi:hypothetical protein
MNGTTPQMNFQDYKKLSQEERDFFLFDKMCKIDDIADKMPALDKKFASKWVETGAKALVGIVLVTVVGAMLALVISKGPQSLAASTTQQ